jgi:hypothetical protein
MSAASKLLFATLALVVTFASAAVVVSPYTHAPPSQVARTR